MSSPIHHIDNLDGALRYAPPRVRVQRQQTTSSSEPAAEEPQGCDYDDDSFSDGHAAPPRRRRRSLDPEIVPAPPPDVEEKSGAGRLLLGLCAAAVVAAGVAWAIVTMPGANPAQHESVQAETASAAIPSDRASKGKDLSRVVSTVRVDQHGNDIGDRAAPARLPRPQPLVTTAAPAAAAPTAEQSPPAVQRPSARPSAPAFVLRQLDRDEVKRLVKRGEDFIASGDLAAARLVLQRAAEAGDVRAALALAGTFDPNLLARLGKQELADAGLARLWYERARQFGSAEAPQRLDQLATQLNAVH
jgi:hypothetical protein